MLNSDLILKPFSLDKHTVLTVDASQHSVGAVLSQDDHPVLFASRKLTAAESNYSNIEREALAVIWACQRLEHFLVGKKFSIQTDHKPLVYIFDPTQSLKTDISQRLMRFSLKMMRFDYEIKHLPGKQNNVADLLSRTNFDTSVDSVKLPVVHFSEPCNSIDTLKTEYAGDEFLQSLKRRIVSGNWTALSPRERLYKRYCNALTVEDEIIRLGSRIIPPQSLYRRIFDVVHQTHQGCKATLTLVQREFFWPQMLRTIEGFTYGCEMCANARFRAVDTTHAWPKETAPWTRVHIDWGHHSRTGNILIIADAMSGWVEAIQCANRTTATVIHSLRELFARFGVPHTLVSDNAAEFSNDMLFAWLRNCGCKLMFSPEYRPQANGLAERMVRVVKDSLKCFSPFKSSIQSYLQRLLFVHRNTAMREGKTPAQHMLGRHARCPILSQFTHMQSILYKPHAKAMPTPVTFVMKQGRNTSLVTHENGRVVVAHDAQLAARLRRSCRVTGPPRRYPDEDPELKEGDDVHADTMACRGNL